MKIKLVLFFIVWICSMTVKSQSISDTSVQLEKCIVRLHALPIGLGVEIPLKKQSTISFDLGGMLAFQLDKNNKVLFSDNMLNPYLSIESRLYTNLLARKNKGKRIDFHSGAYGAFKLQGGRDLTSMTWYLQTGPLVGFQRMLGLVGYWSVGLGCGALIRNDEFGFGLIGDFKFGLVLNNPKTKKK